MTISDDLDEAFIEAERRMMRDFRLTPREFVEQHLKGELGCVTYWRSSRADKCTASDASRTKNLRAVEAALDRLGKARGEANGPV